VPKIVGLGGSLT